MKGTESECNQVLKHLKDKQPLALLLKDVLDVPTAAAARSSFHLTSPSTTKRPEEAGEGESAVVRPLGTFKPCITTALSGLFTLLL